MIVLDTDILSYFSKLNRLQLLTDLFATPLLVSPNTRRELEEGFQLGYRGLQPALDLIQTGSLEVLTMTEAARALVSRMRTAPGKGETDSLAYCLAHHAVFVTNDRRTYRQGRKLGIQCLRLPTLLRLLWTHGVLDRVGVQELVAEIETRLNFAVGDQEAIFDRPD